MRLSHVGWNVCGLALPLGIAALTVPQLIEKLGQERFGLLALAWGLIGYAGALDLGVGRALTQMVSRSWGENNTAIIPAMLATAARITLVTGVIGGVLIAFAAFASEGAFVRANSLPESELRTSVLLLAIALPAQAMSATYRGLNEALLNFKGISLLRAGLGVANFAGPWLVSLFTTQLPWLVVTLVASRLVALLVFRGLAVRSLQRELNMKASAAYSPSIARSLFSFGGWITISSIISPMLVQADRFVIASTLSAAAVATYVLPYEVVVQSSILVGAVSSVIFPSLSKLMREKPDQWLGYFKKWTRRIALLMGCVCLALNVMLPSILPLWIPVGLDPVSVTVGQILCVGVFANAIGSMFYAALHAKGRVDLTARLHIVEFPLFMLALFISINYFGLIGAAWAWVGRMAFDSIALALALRWCRD